MLHQHTNWENTLHLFRRIQVITESTLVKSAAAVDSFGSGLVMTLGVLFFVLTTDIPLTQIGFSVAAGGLVALPIGIVGGWIIDSKGSRFGMVANNLLAAAGFSLFLFAQTPLLIFFASSLISIGDRIYWAAWTTYIHDLSGDEPYENLFGRLEAVKMAAMSLGAILGALAMAINSISGAYFAVILNIVVTIMAAIIYSWTPMPDQIASEPDISSEKKKSLFETLKLVILQPGFFPLTIGQFLLAPIMVLPNVALSVFFVSNWGMSAAIAPVIFGINAGVVAIFQEKTTHHVRYFKRTSTIFLGVLLISLTLTILSFLPTPLNIMHKWAIVTIIGIILAVVDMLYMPATNALMANIPKSSVRGKSIGIFQTAMAVGMALYPSFVGLLEYNPNYLWILTSISVFTGAVCYWVAAKNTKENIKYQK